MVVLNPLYLNGVDYNAEDERRGLSGLVAQASAGVPRSGVLGAAPAVSLSGSTVQVGAFNAVVGTAKGGYLTGVDSVTSAGTLTPADQTNGRLDRVILEVLDPDNGSGGTERGRRLRIVSGTPAALPGLPPLPINSLHVAQVQVPRSGAGNPVVTVDCQFTAAAGAPVPVRNEVERDALDPALVRQALRLDNGGTDFVQNGAWASQIVGFTGSAGWALVGVIERNAISTSNIRNRLVLKLRRIGGSFTIERGSISTLTGAVIPAAVRPSEPIEVPVTYMSSALTYGGSGVVRIEPNGTIGAYPTLPTTSINLSQGGYFNISAEWVQ